VTDALTLLAGFVLDTGHRWGETALPFQWDDVRSVLDVQQGAPRRHFWLRARGMSKTTDAAAVALALLVTEAPPRSRSYCYASDEDQASLALDTVAGIVQRTGLREVVDVGARSVTCRATGATLTVEASDSASAFGTRPWLVLVDELAMWPDVSNYSRLWGAIVSATGKVEGARLLVMSSAGSPSHPAFKRWSIASESPHWRTSIAPGPSPWWSSADVAAAAEQLTPTEYRRYLDCDWAEADDSLATTDDVAACVGSYRVLEPVRGTRYVMALDIGTRRDASVLAVGHLERPGTGRRVVIDRVLRWSGTRDDPVSLGEVETALLACWRSYGRPRLVYDFHQAAQLTERLKKAGVGCTEFTFSTAGVNRLARTLFGVLRDRAILLPDDEELLAELGSVRLVETGPGLVRLDHRSGEHDDQAVTVAMVAASLLDRPTGGGRIHVATGELPPIRLIRAVHITSEPGVPVVDPETRRRRYAKGDTVRIGRFTVPRRGYTPPGIGGR
jgi:hypothetical protein